MRSIALFAVGYLGAAAIWVPMVVRRNRKGSAPTPNPKGTT